MVDNFSFGKNLITDWKGYDSCKDKTILEQGWLVRGSKNVIKKRSGTIAARQGLKRRGEPDNTNAGVKSDYVWKTSWGSEIYLRVCNSKLQFESKLANGSTLVFYDLMTSLTLTDFSFRSWWDNTDKKDKLLFVMGNSNIYSWSGGITMVASGTVNTITKSDATTTWAQDGFATTGTVTVNGIDYTYTGGTNTSTLTGTADASGLTAGLGFAKVITTSNSPASTFKTNFIEVINNQLYCLSSTSQLIYISSQTDFTNFTEPGTRAAGDPKIARIDSIPNGIAIRQGKAHIFAGTSDLYIVSFSDITGGTSLVNQIVVDKKPLAGLQSCLGHNFIDAIGDTIIYLSQDQQLRTYGDYRSIFAPVFPTLSFAIFDELAEEDFTGGQLKAIGEFIYIIAPLSGKTYLHQTRQSVDALGDVSSERLWHPYQQWGISRVCEISGVEHGASNANPQIYQLWDTNQWYDDSPDLSSDGVTYQQLPYECKMSLSYNNHGRRQGMISFDKAFYEGYITNGTTLNTNINYEYQGFEDKIDLVISSPSDQAFLMTGDSAPSIGDASMGDNPIGDGLSVSSNDQDKLPKFKTILQPGQTNCSEYQIEVYSEDASSRWEIICIGTNATLSEEEQAIKFTK